MFGLPNNIMMVIWLSVENFLEGDNILVSELNDLPWQIEFFLHTNKLTLGFL